MKGILLLVGFLTLSLIACDRLRPAPKGSNSQINFTNKERPDSRTIPAPLLGSWFEAKGDGTANGELEVGSQSIKWTRDEDGARETTVCQDYTIIGAESLSFPAFIVAARGVFNPSDKTGRQVPVTVTLNGQGLVLSTPEIRLDEGAYVQTVPARTKLYSHR